MDAKDIKLKKHLENTLKAMEKQFEEETAWLREGIAKLTKKEAQFIETIPPEKEESVTKQHEPITVNTKIIKILEQANEPMTSVEIMEKLNINYGHHYRFSGFSGMLSQIHSKPTSKFTKVQIPHGGRKFKFIYALNEWLEAGNLKNEYFEKLRKRVNLPDFSLFEMKRAT